jgi:Signal transduction histidine kinase
METDPGNIRIMNHGEGIPPQMGDKIFQWFWRADNSRARESGGSGIGLAIVAGIDKRQGGAVAVNETPGGGATFEVSLPAVPPD